jgi:hypothetical protein
MTTQTQMMVILIALTTKLSAFNATGNVSIDMTIIGIEVKANLTSSSGNRVIRCCSTLENGK